MRNNWQQTNIHTHAGNYTFAAVRGQEGYDIPSAKLQLCIDEIHSLLDHPIMTVDGVPCALEFFLGGDYKVSCVKGK